MRWLAILVALWISEAEAQSAADDARAAADQLVLVRAILEAAQTRADRVAALTETVQAYENGLAALRDGLRRAAIRQQTLEADLAARSEDVAKLLGVLQTMQRAPAPLLLLHPSGPTGTARSGMMLADVTPALQVKVDELRLQLQELGLLQTLQEDAFTVLEDGLEGAQQARIELSEAIADRTDLPKRFEEDPVALALLAASAQTMDAFANDLARLPESETGPDVRAQAGTIPLPVAGEVLRQFNEADAAGIIRPGIIVATRPRALVSAPVAATVRYAGPLLEYERVIVLEPAADVLWVIAGLVQVFGEAGQVVPAGTPIGLMGGDVGDAQAILTESAQGSTGRQTESLYLEVRDRQNAVDPAIWFAFE